MVEKIFFKCDELDKQQAWLKDLLVKNKPQWIIDTEEEGETDFSYSCDFYAVFIDTSVSPHQLVGRAKAMVYKPYDSKSSLPDIVRLPDVRRLSTDKDYVYISRVDINPEYQRRKFCQKILEFLITEIQDTEGGPYDYFVIFNASETEGSVPACKCYVRSGINTGFDMYKKDDSKYNTRTGNWDDVISKMSVDKCAKYMGRGMPDFEYYFIKKGNEGGKVRKRRSRSKTRRKHYKKHNTKRKHKSHHMSHRKKTKKKQGRGKDFY